jgi:hypothetical protein
MAYNLSLSPPFPVYVIKTRFSFFPHKREKRERVRDYKPLKGRKEWESCFYYVNGKRGRE